LPRKIEPAHLFRFLLMTGAVIINAFLAGAPHALASNGTNLPAYSAAALGQGGADLVSINDTSQLNNNPAALTLVPGDRIDLTLMYIQPFYHYRDAFNNSASQNDGYLPGNFSYAGHLASNNEYLKRLTIGAGIFSQGGFGSNYQRISTVLGTTDSAASYLRYLKFSLGVSYDVIASSRHKLSIGAAPHLAYSDLSLSLFPGTSVAPSPGLPTGFAGVSIHDSCARNLGVGTAFGSCPHDWAAGVKVGFMYAFMGDDQKVTRPKAAVGASYTSQVDFDYTGGRMDVNLSSAGLGRVTYDASVEGFKWPQQVDVGFAYRPLNSILLALDVSWIQWSALRTVTIKGTNPQNSIAAATPGLSKVDLPFVFNWKDQALVAFGVAIDCWAEMFGERSCEAESGKWFDSNRLTVRAGYNYSNNPVPSQTLTPLGAVIIEHHVTGGLGYRFSDHWSADFSGLYGFKNTDSTTGFFTPGLQSTSGYFLYGTLSWFF
jgi:long-chain fatty acid transport protein